MTAAAVALLFILGSSAQAGPDNARAVAARAALNRALALFEGRASDPRGATMVLRDLAARTSFLSPAERRLARSILARPTDGAADPLRNGYSVGRTYFRRLCATNFCVHWVVSGRDAPSLTDRNPRNRIPDYIDKVKAVMTNVWNTEVITLNYRAPKPDGNAGGHRGGNPNGKLDVLVADVGRKHIYGYCASDDPARGSRSDVSAYCVVDDDFARAQFTTGAYGQNALKVTAAHEFHHASQFAYDFREDRSFMESTATNMEAAVYPTIHDNYQYFPSSPLRSTNTNTNGPWKPIDLFSNGTNQYGAWIWYRFLAERFTTSATRPITTEPDQSIVREMWEAAQGTPGTLNGGKYSTQAVADVLTNHSASFAQVFHEFGVANARPAGWYKDGALYPTAGQRTFTLDFGFVYTFEKTMFHLSNDYYAFVPGDNTASIAFSATFPDAAAGSKASVLVFNTAGGFVSQQQIPLDVNGDGSLPAMGFSFSTGKIVVVFTNGSTRFANCGTDNTLPLYSCRGNSLDDSPRITNPAAAFDWTLNATVPMPP